jgi:hypothetical protein
MGRSRSKLIYGGKPAIPTGLSIIFKDSNANIAATMIGAIQGLRSGFGANFELFRNDKVNSIVVNRR